MCTACLIPLWQLCIFLPPVVKGPNRRHDILSGYLQRGCNSNWEAQTFPECVEASLFSSSQTFCCNIQSLYAEKSIEEAVKIAISLQTVDSKAQNAMYSPSPFLEPRKPLLLLLLHCCYHCCSVHPHGKSNPQLNTRNSSFILKCWQIWVTLQPLNVDIRQSEAFTGVL